MLKCGRPTASDWNAYKTKYVQNFELNSSRKLKGLGVGLTHFGRSFVGLPEFRTIARRPTDPDPNIYREKISLVENSFFADFGILAIWFCSWFSVNYCYSSELIYPFDSFSGLIMPSCCQLNFHNEVLYFSEYFKTLKLWTLKRKTLKLLTCIYVVDAHTWERKESVGRTQLLRKFKKKKTSNEVKA